MSGIANTFYTSQEQYESPIFLQQLHPYDDKNDLTAVEESPISQEGIGRNPTQCSNPEDNIKIGIEIIDLRKANNNNNNIQISEINNIALKEMVSSSQQMFNEISNAAAELIKRTKETLNRIEESRASKPKFSFFRKK